MFNKSHSTSAEKRHKDKHTLNTSRVSAKTPHDSKPQRAISPKPSRKIDQCNVRQEKSGNHDNEQSRSKATKPSNVKKVNEPQKMKPATKFDDVPPVNAIPLAELEANLLGDQWDSSEELELLTDDDLSGSHDQVTTPIKKETKPSPVSGLINDSLGLLPRASEVTKSEIDPAKLVAMFSQLQGPSDLPVVMPTLDLATPTLDLATQAQVTPTSNPTRVESKYDYLLPTLFGHYQSCLI